MRWAVAALVFGFIGWIWRSWTNPRGLVDLHVLKDRNFRTGCFLIALLGMCIYITIAILPLYYQEILGYTAFTAGLVVGPRGIGSFIGSPVIGILGSRIDNRKLLSAGFIGFGICSYIFGTVNLDIGPYTLLLPILLTGFALSFVFVPLATMTTSTLLARRNGQRHGALQHAAEHRRVNWDCDGHDRHHSPRRPAPERNRCEPLCINSMLQQKSRMIAGYLGHQFGRAPARPGSLGLMYGLHAAAIRSAGLRRCLSLDRGARLLLLPARRAGSHRQDPANNKRHPQYAPDTACNMIVRSKRFITISLLLDNRSHVRFKSLPPQISHLTIRINLASAGAGLIHYRGRGVGVFAISPTSLAAKENRTGSRQTLPRFLFPFFGVFSYVIPLKRSERN